jgi:hypothetical protein
VNEMDKKDELKKRCEEMKYDPTFMKECKFFLGIVEEKNVVMEDDPNQTYISMAESISPEDLPKVLEMALKIAKSSKITDTDLKIAAEKLIRTLEPL